VAAAGGMAGVALIPLVHPDRAYVLAEYRTSLRTMDSAGHYEMARGQDLRGCSRRSI